MDPPNHMSTNSNSWTNNRNICFICTSSLTTAAQITFETYCQVVKAHSWPKCAFLKLTTNPPQDDFRQMARNITQPKSFFIKLSIKLSITKYLLQRKTISYREYYYYWRVNISPPYLPLHKQHGNHTVTDDSVISKACPLNDWMINYNHIIHTQTKN